MPLAPLPWKPLPFPPSLALLAAEFGDPLHDTAPTNHETRPNVVVRSFLVFLLRSAS